MNEIRRRILKKGEKNVYLNKEQMNDAKHDHIDTVREKYIVKKKTTKGMYALCID